MKFIRPTPRPGQSSFRGLWSLSQSVIGTYIPPGWSQTVTRIDGKGHECYGVFERRQLTLLMVASPCTIAGFTTTSAASPSFSSCNLNTSCTGTTGSAPGVPIVNYQHAYVLLTVSGSSCASGALNGIYPAFRQYGTSISGRDAQYPIAGTAITATCSSDFPSVTYTPVIAAYGEQVQFLDGTNGGFNASLLPASAPVSSQITATTGAKLPYRIHAIFAGVDWPLRFFRPCHHHNPVARRHYQRYSASPYTISTSQYAMVHFLSDGNHNWYIEGGSGGSGVTWPASADLVISNGTNTPAGLAPVNGDCVLGSGGAAWTAGACAGITLTTTGTSGAATLSGGTLNIPVYTGSGGGTGQLLNVVTLTGSGTYTPTGGTTSIIIELVGGGGGGSGIASPGSNINIGLGGQGGGWLRKRLTTGFSGATYSVGALGAGGAAAILPITVRQGETLPLP